MDTRWRGRSGRPLPLPRHRTTVPRLHSDGNRRALSRPRGHPAGPPSAHWRRDRRSPGRWPRARPCSACRLAPPVTGNEKIVATPLCSKLRQAKVRLNCTAMSRRRADLVGYTHPRGFAWPGRARRARRMSAPSQRPDLQPARTRARSRSIKFKRGAAQGRRGVGGVTRGRGQAHGQNTLLPNPPLTAPGPAAKAGANGPNRRAYAAGPSILLPPPSAGTAPPSPSAGRCVVGPRSSVPLSFSR